jgi:hypothetical protein
MTSLILHFDLSYRTGYQIPLPDTTNKSTETLLYSPIIGDIRPTGEEGLSMGGKMAFLGAMKDLDERTLLKVAGNVEKARADFRSGANLKYLHWSNFVQNGVFQRHPEPLSVVTPSVTDAERLRECRYQY